MERWPLAIIALVATVASAGRMTTFAWNNGTDWPAGTTVELCSNGICASGLTGTQHTLDVPIQPGETINALVRAVAPAEYQCGDPPAPCPYSEWATVVQTWPALPTYGWATIKEVISMANDSFTNTNGTALTTHDSNWSFGTGNDSGRIYNNGVSYSAQNAGYYRRTDSTSDTSQIVLFGGESNLFSKVRPAVRMSSSVSGYSFGLQGSASTWDTLNFYKNSGWTSLATSLSYAKANNHTLRIVASGSGSTVTVTCYINDVLILTYNDSTTPYTSGNPGIFLMGDGADNYAFGDDWTDGVSASAGLPRRAIDGPFYGATRGSVR